MKVLVNRCSTWCLQMWTNAVETRVTLEDQQVVLDLLDMFLNEDSRLLVPR